VPTSGSSLHLALMHISWPSQSLKVLQGPLQEEIACEEMMLRRKNTQTKTNILSICRFFFMLAFRLQRDTTRLDLELYISLRLRSSMEEAFVRIQYFTKISSSKISTKKASPIKWPLGNK
jgi:hypothetical protein